MEKGSFGVERSGGVPPGSRSIIDRDEAELARVGKKQILKRRFGFISMTGFSCILMVTWEGLLVDFLLGLENGGPAGLVYGYLIAWLGTLSVFTAIGELSSMLPTAGGQYHWVHVLAPRSKVFLSYITGWATVISWMAAATGVAFFSATLLQNLISLNIPIYAPKGWQGTLIMWAVLAVGVFIATSCGKILPVLEIVLLIIHVLGFFATMIPLAYHAKGGSDRAHEIFTTFFNLGGWSTQSLSFFVGLQGNAAAFLGTDGAVHMSEEVENSSVNVARSMIYAIILNGILGFSILITLFFSVDNIKSLTQSTSTYPFIQILASNYESVGAATAIASAIITLNFFVVIGAVSASGRMIWSFAREGGLPGSLWLKQVDKRTSIPYNACVVTAVAAGLIGLINIGSTTALNDVISLILEGFYTSYFLAISVLFYRRVRGEIRDPDEVDASTVHQEGYVWGPWRIKGWLGTLNNLVAIIYLLVVGFFSFWPGSAKVTPATMNYSCAVLGFVIIVSACWYFIRARSYYTGPVHEVAALGTRVYTFPQEYPQEY